jgi:hypothetical protein
MAEFIETLKAARRRLRQSHLRAHIGRLKILASALEERVNKSSIMSVSYVVDFKDIIEKIGHVIGEECSFLSDNIGSFSDNSNVYTSSLRPHVRQAIAFFNEAYAKELDLAHCLQSHPASKTYRRVRPGVSSKYQILPKSDQPSNKTTKEASFPRIFQQTARASECNSRRPER